MEKDLKLFCPFWCWVQVYDSTIEYKDTVKQTFTFSTIKEFWTYYQHMNRPYRLKQADNIYYFKKGVEPFWEDKQNLNGACFKIKLHKNKSSRQWQDLILMLISPNNKFSNQINGIRLHVKSKFDWVEIWVNQSAHNKKSSLQDYIRRAVLNNDQEIVIDYKSFSVQAK